MSIEDQVVRQLKDVINTGNFNEFINEWRDLRDDTDYGREIAWDYIFQKVYIHACLKKAGNITEYLLKEFQLFDPIQQIAMKPTFSYVKYI